jgi:phosphonate transport system permease protein
LPSALPGEPSLPFAQLIEPAVSATLGGADDPLTVSLDRVADSELERSIRRNRQGLIRVRTLSRANVILGVTFVIIAALTVYTMLTLNYGKAAFLTALGQAASDFWTMMTEPSLGKHFTLVDVLEGALVSLALAILTTVISAVIAFVLGLFAAANLSNRVVSNSIKAVMSLFRAVPTILWVLVFTVAIGLGPEAAVCGLMFHGVAYLVKAYSESFEEVDPGVIEALRASGTSWWQLVFQAIVPEKMSEMLSWTFIRFEINFVNAVAVGAVAGAGGVGYQLYLAGSFYHNIHEVGFITYLCLAVAAVLEVIATRLRGRYIA